MNLKDWGEIPYEPSMRRTTALLVLVAVLSAMGARFLILPVNDGGAAILGMSYTTAAVLLVPWIENTWMLAIAQLARIFSGGPLGLFLVFTTSGFAIQERLFLYPSFPSSLPLVYVLRSWTYGPLALMAGAGLFLLLRHLGRPMDAYLAWILWHGLWNYYWLVLA